ncbi:MAG: hypothetical protein HW386_1604 [Gammaproteobacteria bacterium]|nr:hypothetical protein [Gammaproteobacteria bacterium]
MGVLFVLRGNNLEQLIFNFQHIPAGSEPGTIGDSVYMSIHGDGWLTESCIQNDIGSLPADTRQSLQGFSVRGNLSLMLFDQEPAGVDNMFRLRVV